MKTKLIIISMLAMLLTAQMAYARGGFSSGGGRGGFSSARSSGSSGRSYSAPRSTTTVVRNTTINRSYSGTYYHPMGYGYGAFGMGYGYNNGLITGLILGNLMHPQGTIVYNGSGYGGSALLYPNGMVVDSNGYQVGTYVNGIFTAVHGGMVAQPAPAGQSQDATGSSLALIVIVLLIFVIFFIAI